MTDKEAEKELEVVSEAIREVVRDLLGNAEVHPQILAMALARVTGEVGAGMAVARDVTPGAVVDGLAEIVRRTGEVHDRALRRTPGLPAARLEA